MTYLRKAAEMALEAMERRNSVNDEYKVYLQEAIETLRQALAQPEQKKEPTPSNVDPRVLLISDSDFTKETGNRLCDIERRLAAIETQPNEANKKPHAVSYKDGVPVAHYNFDPPPYTAPPSKQEPVAWQNKELPMEFYEYEHLDPMWHHHYRPLYTAPVSKPWVSLTEEESSDIYNAHHNTHGECITSAYELVLDVEAKLKEKNT